MDAIPEAEARVRESAGRLPAKLVERILSSERPPSPEDREQVLEGARHALTPHE